MTLSRDLGGSLDYSVYALVSAFMASIPKPKYCLLYTVSAIQISAKVFLDTQALILEIYLTDINNKKNRTQMTHITN